MAPPPVIAIGERYGRLLVVRLLTERKRRHRQYVCRCDCGRRTVASATYLRGGHVTSCGCRRGSEPGRAGGARYPAA